MSPIDWLVTTAVIIALIIWVVIWTLWFVRDRRRKRGEL